jgi:hypothetical protein
VLKVGDNEFRLNGTDKLQEFEFTMKKKDKVSIDQDRFYIKTQKM